LSIVIFVRSWESCTDPPKVKFIRFIFWTLFSRKMKVWWIFLHREVVRIFQLWRVFYFRSLNIIWGFLVR